MKSDQQLWEEKMADSSEICTVLVVKDNGMAKLYQAWFFFGSVGIYPPDRTEFYIWCDDKWERFTDYLTAYKAWRERYDDR